MVSDVPDNDSALLDPNTTEADPLIDAEPELAESVPLTLPL
jgi:hypothetical protein